MRRKTLGTLLIALVATLVIPLAVAQKTNGTPAAPKYDVSKEVKIKGTIEDVKEMPMGKNEVGIHLTVKTATETVEVRLCPTGYLKDFEVTFTKGQQLEVTGSRIKIDDQDVVLAREVVQGNNTLTLRDKSGTPVWTWLKKG